MGLSKAVRFISQREQDCFPDDSCHIACLAMILEFSGFKPMPTYAKLCAELNIDQEIQDEYDPSAEEVVKFLCRHNIKFRLLFQKDEWETSLQKAPIMVAMYGGRRFWGREGHAIVLTKLENGKFTYLDPWFISTKDYVKTIATETFYRHFKGFACQIIG